MVRAVVVPGSASQATMMSLLRAGCQVSGVRQRGCERW